VIYFTAEIAGKNLIWKNFKKGPKDISLAELAEIKIHAE